MMLNRMKQLAPEPVRAGGHRALRYASNQWFRRRRVFCMRRERYRGDEGVNASVEIVALDDPHDRFGQLTDRQRAFVCSWKPEAVLSRSGDPLTACFVAVDRATREAVGSYWMVRSGPRRVWDDCIWIDPHMAVGRNLRVAESHRRRGIARALKMAAFERAFSDPRCTAYLAVVEFRNSASTRLLRSIPGHEVWWSCLIKWFGRNIVSVLVAGRRVRVYYVPAQARRQAGSPPESNEQEVAGSAPTGREEVNGDER